MSRLPWSVALLLMGCVSLTASAGNEFALPEAMTAAGEQVPATIDTYSFFYVQSEQTSKHDAEDLAARLRTAAAESDYIGVAGPDAALNRKVLTTALAANKGHNLRGLKLIYLGPAGDSAAVASLIQPSGVELRYVVYPKPGP